MNPHSRYGHRILSPACLPFHHPGLPLKLMVSLVFDYQKELVHFSCRMVECPPHKLAASLKTPTGCFLNARPYHPGFHCPAVLWSCSLESPKKQGKFRKISSLHKNRFAQSGLLKLFKLGFCIAGNNIIHFCRVDVFLHYLKLFFRSKGFDISFFLPDIVGR